jgi:hypothetical protein
LCAGCDSRGSGQGGVRLGPALAVPLDQLLQLRQVVDNVDPSASVQLRRLQQPQVKTREMTERHRIPKEVLLQHALLLVKCLLLLLDVLLNQSPPVVVEMLEYKRLLIRVCRLPLSIITLGGGHKGFKLLFTLGVITTSSIRC